MGNASDDDNESDGDIKYTYGNLTIHYVDFFHEYGLPRTARKFKLSAWFSFD